MLYRKIGSSDLEVSVLSLGSWVLGGDDSWAGDVEDEVSIQVVERALDHGINMIDTAPIYGAGRAEEVVGKAIKGKREQFIIATKCGLEQKGGSIRPNLSASFIREEIEGSLRRLGVETVDLYQCHWPDPSTPREETFSELNKLVEEGKVRYIGVSNFDKNLLSLSLPFAKIVSNQVQYSLFNREIEEDLIPFCENKNVSILAYGPLGGGILTGKYKEPPSFPKGDARSFFYKYYSKDFFDKSKYFIKALEEIADNRKVSVSQVAINWSSSKEVVATCITGCRTPEQLDENAGSGRWMLSRDELDFLEKEYREIFLK